MSRCIKQPRPFDRNWRVTVLAVAVARLFTTSAAFRFWFDFLKADSGRELFPERQTFRGHARITLSRRGAASTALDAGIKTGGDGVEAPERRKRRGDLA